MECRATSPTAASLAAADELKIKWRHDNHNIKERDRNAILMASAKNSFLMPYTTTETQIHHEASNNQTTIIGYLRLFNISYESAGKYQCVVSNAFGTTYSQKFKMSIGSKFDFKFHYEIVIKTCRFFFLISCFLCSTSFVLANSLQLDN